MKQKFFETSFGHVIPINENYARDLPPPPNRTDILNASSIAQTKGAKAPVENEYGIMSDIYQFAFAADWLQTTVIGDRCFDRMLDIGGSSGLMGQLFKAVRRVRTVENIEILDFREDPTLLHRVRYLLGRIQDGRKQLDSSSRFHLMNRAKGALKWIDFMQEVYPFPIDRYSNYWKVTPQSLPALDRYI